MTATVADVITLLGGTVHDAVSYDIFGYTILTSAIAMQLDFAQEYYDGDFFSASLLLTRWEKIDKIIILETAVCLLSSQIMGTLMVSGFSYSVLEHSVNVGNFPDIVKNSALGFAQFRDKLIHQLVDSADYNVDTAMGVEYWGDGLGRFAQDTIPY